MFIPRRGFLVAMGLAWLSVATPPSFAQDPAPAVDFNQQVVIIFTSDTEPRTQDIVASFKEHLGPALRLTYDLGGRPDAGAFVADNTREIDSDLVFAVGDLALKAAAREFSTERIVFADVVDPSVAEGRDNIEGVSASVDPAQVVARLKSLMPEMQTLGVLEGRGGNTAYYDAVAEAATRAGLGIERRSVASAADVPNAVDYLLSRSDLIWLQSDARVWSPSLLSTVFRDGAQAGKPIVGFARTHMQATPPPALVLVSDAAGQGRAAANLARAHLGRETSSEVGTYATPVLVSRLDAARAGGLRLRKATVDVVDEWLD